MRVPLSAWLSSFGAAPVAEAANLFEPNYLHHPLYEYVRATEFRVFDIDDNGRTVGRWYNSNGGRYTPILWDADGSATDLAKETGNFVISGTVYGINDAGHIVGTSHRDVVTYRYDAQQRRWRLTTVKSSLLSAFAGTHYGADINNAGEIVVTDLGTAPSFFIDSNRTATRLSDHIRLTDVNDSGQYVGGGGFIGALVDGTEQLTAIPIPAGYSFSGAQDINNGGVVVGTVRDEAGGTRGFVYKPESGTELLPLLPGFSFSGAAGINNDGDIVGYAVDESGTSSTAILWHRGVTYNLNDYFDTEDTWYMFSAADISDTGYIYGVGRLDDLSVHVTLTPLAPIPEPSTVTVQLLVGLFMLGRRRRSLLEIRRLGA